MKLKKLGKLYKLNSKDRIVCLKKTETEFESNGVLSCIIDYVYSIVNYEPKSVYLRGSLSHKKIFDDTVVDLDMVFVYDNTDYFDFYGTQKHKCLIMNPYLPNTNELVLSDEKRIIEHKIYEMIGRCIEIDINLHSEKSFMDNHIHRFQSKKIYGEGLDLSVSHLTREILNDIKNIEIANKKEVCYERLLHLKDFFYKETTFEGDLRDRMIKNVCKLFFRQYSFELLLKNECYSSDIYYCYTSIVEEYPYYSNHLEDVLDLFLNTKSYTDREVRYFLSKLEYLIDEINLLDGIQYNKV